MGTMGTISMQDSQEQSVDEEIKDIPTLMRILKKSAIDREKIVAIKKFIDEGGEELYYLAQQVCLCPEARGTKLMRLDTRYHVHAHISKLASPTALQPDEHNRQRKGTSRGT